MCGHCHDEWSGCYSHHYSRSNRIRAGYYEEPTPEDRREYLEEEKRRLKEIEARMAAATK